MNILRFIGGGLKSVCAVVMALVLIASTYALADYTLTQGTGITMASVVISTKHYIALLICDATAGESQCAAVNASGGVSVAQQGSWAVTANAGTNLNTSALATSAIQGALTDVPCTLPASATSCSQIAIAKAEANAVNSPIPTQAASMVIGGVGQVSQYPTGAVPITASATGTTAATTATLAGTGSKTTYICTSSVRANATAATTVTDTITGVITGTMSSELWVAPAASGLGVDEQVFSPCVPASGTNTGIAVVSGAPGTGGLVSVHATGYQL